MQRVDITPRFKAPYNGVNQNYNSPWFHNNPPLPGPDGNNVRTYTGASDYDRLFNGWKAPIAVMGPDIDDNIARCLDFDDAGIKAGAECAKVGTAKIPGFKLIASLWSPAPWVKVSSGRKAMYNNEPMPKNNPPYPFVWFNNFAGGTVDTSGTPRPEFDDSSLPGGKGATSALTQFARGLAAYVRGYQNKFGLKFYAISLQNEPHLELFYNSSAYKTATDYIAVLKATRAEFDKYPDLKPIQFMGYEDTIGSESTYLWFWNDQNLKFDKFLKVMQAVEADPVAAKALAFYTVHGYAQDGIASAGAEPQVWNWCRYGWTKAPSPQLPDNVKGYESFGKKCWMTETSGEGSEWLEPKTGFPNNGAFSIALKLHQALSIGDVSGWMYWQMGAGGGDKPDVNSLVYSKTPTMDPKYVAAKHYFRYIRPGARRLETKAVGDKELLCTTFLHQKDHTLTMVMINASATAKSPTIPVPTVLGSVTHFEAFTSSNGALWQHTTLIPAHGKTTVAIPGYGVTTLVGTYKTGSK